MSEAAGKRVGDTEREEYARTLRTAFAEGRITSSELEERLEEVFASKTEDQLLPVVSDLPERLWPEAARPSPAPVARTGSKRAMGPLIGKVLAFYFPALICTAIWAMTGAGYFWPMWVFFGLSIPAFGMVIAMLSGETSDDTDDTGDDGHRDG